MQMVNFKGMLQLYTAILPNNCTFPDYSSYLNVLRDKRRL